MECTELLHLIWDPEKESCFECLGLTRIKLILEYIITIAWLPGKLHSLIYTREIQHSGIDGTLVLYIKERSSDSCTEYSNMDENHGVFLGQSASHRWITRRAVIAKSNLVPNWPRKWPLPVIISTNSLTASPAPKVINYVEVWKNDLRVRSASERTLTACECVMDKPSI